MTTWHEAEISKLHELARLEAQLDALEEDIEAARAGARAAGRGGLDLRRRGRHARPRGTGERVRLPGGAEVLIRPIEPDDAAELELEFEHLGALSRYRGFVAPAEHLTDAQVQRLTHVDHVTHEALVAEDPVRGELVGTARYAQVPAEPRRATMIVVVADAWQGRGVGTALAERLAARARACRLERVTGRTIVGDARARRLLAHVGETIDEHADGGVVEITVALGSSR